MATAMKGYTMFLSPMIIAKPSIWKKQQFLNDAAGLLGGISSTMRSANMTNEDAAQALVDDAIEIAFRQLCDVAHHLRRNGARLLDHPL